MKLPQESFLIIFNIL